MIKKYTELCKRALKKATSGGFFHIIISSSLTKIVSFISAIFLPKIITSKADYGLLVYVDNIRSYVLLFNGIGIANACLRYCANEKDNAKKKGYFLVTLGVGIVFDIALIVLSIVAYSVLPLQFSGSRIFLIALAVLPIFAFLFDDVTLFLRACFENKKYSVLSFFYSLMMVVAQVGLALLWKLNGVVIGRYVAVIATLGVGYFLIKKLSIMTSKAVIPPKKEIRAMIIFGIIMMLTNSISNLMQLDETFILGAVLKNQSVLADYRVASYILTISLFIAQSVVIFAFPYFARHMNDKVWIWSNFKKMMIVNAIVMIPLHLGLIAGSPLIILFFGKQYMNAVRIMQMLLIASLAQATLRMLPGNVLAATGEEKFNLRINILFTIIHAAVDVWAIMTFGIMGAAVALTLVYFLSGIVMIIHLRNVCLHPKAPAA